MKIAVLVKQVPGSEARIRIASGGASIDPAEVQLEVNPYDEYAVEAALQLKEKFGGEVTVIAAGIGKVDEALRKCLALGADKAVWIKDDRLGGADALGFARVLAGACKAEGPDLILCGKVSIDHENSAVGIEVAELLDLPHVSAISRLEAESETRLKVQREVEGGAEVLEVDLPAVLTANKGLNEPRYASLKGIMAAKKKPLQTVDLATLGVPAAEPSANLVSLEYPPPRGEAKILSGEAKETVPQLVKLLKDEAKVL